MKRTKILFLIHTLQVGGAERALVNLVNNLDPKKYDVTVMTIIDTGAFRNKIPSWVHYKTIIKPPHFKNSSSHNQKSGNLLSGTSKIKRAAASIYQFWWRHVDSHKVYKRFITEKYDIEVAFLEGISAKIIASSSNPDSKKLAWIRVDLLNERKSEHFFKNSKDERETYSRFDKIITVSKTVKEQFEKKFDFDPTKVVVKYNIFNTNEIKKLANQKIVSKQHFTLCSVGRLSPQKGYDRLLRVVKRLNEDNLRFDLWIIGVGSEQKNLEKYIQENNLSNVTLLGYKANPYPYIKAADLYVCSSRAEGLSNTVVEAVTLGTPTITVDCSGMHEILGDSKYGIICDNSTSALSSALFNVIQNPEQYQKLAKQVLKRQTFFSTKTSLNEIEKTLYEVIHVQE